MMSASLKDLCRTTFNAFLADAKDGVKRYAAVDQQVREAITGYSGVKTDLRVVSQEQEKDRIRISVVLSDFTSVFVRGQLQETLQLTDASTEADPQKIRFPAALFLPGGQLEKVNRAGGNPILWPAFHFSDDANLPNFLSELGALAESGRLMVRPFRRVIAPTTNLGPDGKELPYIFTADPNLPGQTLVFQDTRPQNAIPLKAGVRNPAEEDQVVTITLPYLKGVPMGVLNSILDDEHEYIAEFRRSLKEVLKDIPAEPGRAEEILNDKVRPATEKVARRFKTIATAHQPRIAGAAALTVSAALGMLNQGGILTIFTALFGGAGFAAYKEFSELVKAKREAKEMPFYLLWRIGKERNL
jgi:hypothetical protein